MKQMMYRLEKLVQQNNMMHTEKMKKIPSHNNQCFVACEARTMNPLLNETVCPITAACAVFSYGIYDENVFS
jgi:hypothetical protein